MSSQTHFLGSMTLKALLEDPNLKNPPIIGQSSNLAKIKKEDGGSDTPQYNYGSAFLGPTLWDKSYGMDLNLEYMDLDEFLSENEIPIVGEDGLPGIGNIDAGKLDLVEEDPLRSGVNTPPNPALNSPRQYLRTPPVSPSQYTIKGSTITPTTILPSFPTTHRSSPSFPTTHRSSPSFPTTHRSSSPSSSPHHHNDHNSSSSSGSPPGSPSFKVDFQVSDQDIALTTIPDNDDPRYFPNAHGGGWMQGGDGHRPKMGVGFDPRKRNFTEEELKPQPIIKKSKKIFVPEDLKDERYWNRRVKNNYAAKRSRDARRVKENQIALRASYLEKENTCMKEEMSKLRKENAKLKAIVEKYEPGTASASTISTTTATLTATGSWPILSP